MALDGIFLSALARELREKLLLGKIDKISQPMGDELVFTVHTKEGNHRLYMSVNPSRSCIYIMSGAVENPPNPYNFCMVMRKHLMGARIMDILQVGSDRILEIHLQTLSELGFEISKKIVIEIMGKHSNITLVDMSTGKVIDSIKRISIDQNRFRQLLPGATYQYPPLQDKIPFKSLKAEDYFSLCHGKTSREILSKIGGISPQVADRLSELSDDKESIMAFATSFTKKSSPIIYFDKTGKPFEFASFNLFDGNVNQKVYLDLSNLLETYYESRETSSRIKQKTSNLKKHLSALLSKAYLKCQKLNEDMEQSEADLSKKIYGELLTSNLYKLKPKMTSIILENYYDGTQVEIPLDPRLSPSQNAQAYFKIYNKAKTALVEKRHQLKETQKDIAYLESVETLLENARDEETISSISEELSEGGYIKKQTTKGCKNKKKLKPISYTLTSGRQVLVGRNNIQNDQLTLTHASKTDLWLHTKDIPGSHVILKLDGREAEDSDILEAAGIAAYHSKGQASENVPVDYCPVKRVKKPNGAKPGMVIFTENKTVWVNPKLPTQKC